MENWRNYLLNEYSGAFGPNHISRVAFENPEINSLDYRAGYSYDSNTLRHSLASVGYNFERGTLRGAHHGGSRSGSITKMIIENTNHLDWPSNQNLTPTWMRKLDHPEAPK